MLATMNRNDTHLDYDVDTRLGQWLKGHRIDRRLSVALVADRTQIAQERILEIEAGTFSRGITRTEAQAFAECYYLNLDEIIRRAID